MILWSRSLVLIHNVLKDLGHLSKSSADKNSIKGKITNKQKKKLKYFLSPFLPLISLFPVSWVYLVSDQRMELRSWWAVLIAVAICLTSSDCHPAELLSNCFVFFSFSFFLQRCSMHLGRKCRVQCLSLWSSMSRGTSCAISYMAIDIKTRNNETSLGKD